MTGIKKMTEETAFKCSKCKQPVFMDASPLGTVSEGRNYIDIALYCSESIRKWVCLNIGKTIQIFYQDQKVKENVANYCLLVKVVNKMLRKYAKTGKIYFDDK